MSPARYRGVPCHRCGGRDRYKRDHRCCLCQYRAHRKWAVDHREYYLNYLKDYGKEYRKL